MSLDEALVMNQDKRLSPHLTWLFALVAVVGGIGISFATARHGWKLSAGLFFGFVGVMAFLSTYLTRATLFQAIGPFVVASLGLGAIYYLVVKSVMTAAASTVGAAGHMDGATTAMGTVAAVLITLDALAASAGGAVFGTKIREVKSPRELLRRPA